MDKIRSILSSATGNNKKVTGPPVPPRPPPAAIQKALEKTRNLSNNNNNINVPIAKGRTVIYTSTNNGSSHQIDQQQRHQASARENKCFDTKLNDSSSSTGLKVIIGRQQQQQQNGNTVITMPARVHNNGASVVGVTSKELPVILHTKSPVPKPRLKTPPLPKSKPPAVPTSPQTEQSDQNSSYTRLLMQNQNSSQNNQHNERREEDFHCGTQMQSGKSDQNIINMSRGSNSSSNKISRDDELKEKLLNEIFSGRLVEASNVHLRYNTSIGGNLKRSSSCDVLNDRNSMVIEKPSLPQQMQHGRVEKVKDRKVMFHEMLISELSEIEMRRAGSDTNHHRQNRLSAAKSCSDLSPTGNKQMTIIEMRDDVKIISRNSNNTCLISLEDSGVEDEEKADDCSSSGVGDSWDSCKDMQNRINISLPGLPPLPKSLSGIELSQHHIQRSQQSNIHQQQQPQKQSQINITSSMSDNSRNTETTLDTQLAILRREMYSLRQLDLSLLSQLWALNESIQEFRTIIEQENFSQQSPSPSNSDLNSLASDDEEVTSCDGKSDTNKITLMELPKNDRTNVKRMNISPPAPPLSSKC